MSIAWPHENLAEEIQQLKQDLDLLVLKWWAAYPIRDDAGRVRAVIYGGRPLNLNFALVDELREFEFGTRLYTGKPLGTVTIFLDGVRVATNVLGPDRQRVVGTFVSQEVQEAVLDTGEVPEKTASYLQRIRQSSGELQDMVKNYLDLSRAERGELRLMALAA